MLLPNEHLIGAGKAYPAAWKNVEIFLKSNGQDLPKWPSWCFLPMAAWYAIVSGGGSNRLGLDMIGDVAKLAAIGTWRYSQGIYRFDRDFFDCLYRTIPSGELPADVLYRLPEWCIYVETPDTRWLNDEMHGFWCHLEWDVNTQRHELRLLMNTAAALVPVVLHVGKWTLTEAVDRAISESLRQAAAHRFAVGLQSEHSEILTSQLYGIVSLLLYICSEEPEIDDDRQPGSFPQRPQPKRTKHGWRLFPAEKPRIWSLGSKSGQALRVAQVYESDGRTLKPHLRRAHWHGFWKGAKDSERKFFYKWLPPMLVGSVE